jgi:hypothetical protein
MRVKHRALGIFAIGSLVAAAILLCGYMSRFGPQLQDNEPNGVNPYYRQVDFAVDAGRIRVWSEYWPTPRTGTPAGFRVLMHGRLFDRPPDLRRVFWEFDAHYLAVTPIKPQGVPVVFIFAFPIWCLLLPCLIVPALWLRRRRRQRLDKSRGFPLDEAAFSPSPR